jgi:hypothetical protein
MNMRTMLRTIMLLTTSKSALETDNEGWTSDSEVEDLDNDDFLGVEQGYGRSAITHPAGQDLASLRRQVGPPERPNKRLLNDCYVEWRRDAFVLTYQSLRNMNARLQCQLAEIHSSGADSAEYLYATKFLTKVLNASTTWLADLEGRVERIVGDTKKRGTSGPWDGKLVQKLVKQRTEDYQKRVKQAEGVMKRTKDVGGDPGQVALPQFTKEDLAQLIRQCPLNTKASAYSFPWLLENIGSRFIVQKRRGFRHLQAGDDCGQNHAKRVGMPRLCVAEISTWGSKGRG